jgi:hypothetical protein
MAYGRFHIGRLGCRGGLRSLHVLTRPGCSLLDAPLFLVPDIRPLDHVCSPGELSSHWSAPPGLVGLSFRHTPEICG